MRRAAARRPARRRQCCPQRAAGTTGKVGVILPDTKSSARWETQDRPNLEAAFKEAGVEYDIQNANGDKAAMATIADQMIANGATVLAIVNLDNESGAAIQKKAAAQGVQTIDYDRLTLGGGADYYVSFDNTEGRRAAGQGPGKCLGAGDKKIVYVNGSPTDNNATLFSAGAHSVLDPMTNYTVVAEQAIPDWDNQVGGTTYEQMYTAPAAPSTACWRPTTAWATRSSRSTRRTASRSR